MEENYERCHIITGSTPDELEIKYVNWQRSILGKLDNNLGIKIIKQQYRPVVNYHGLFTGFAVAVFWHISGVAARSIERCKIFTGDNVYKINREYMNWQKEELGKINPDLGLEIVKRQFRPAVDHRGEFAGYSVAVFWRIEQVPQEAVELEDAQNQEDSIDVEI